MSLSPNVVSYWKLEDVNDTVGGNTLTNNNTISFATAGKIDNGATLNGTSQYLSLADNPSVSFTGDMTWSMWIKPTTTDRPLLVKGTGTTNQSYGFFMDDASKGIEVFFSRLGNNITNTSGGVIGSGFTTGSWQHLVIVYNASAATVEVFRNGASIGSLGSQVTSIYDGTAQLNIGANGTTNAWFAGMMDEVCCWARALSTDDITALYNAGNGFQYPFNYTFSTAVTSYALATKTVNFFWYAYQLTTAVTSYALSTVSAVMRIFGNTWTTTSKNTSTYTNQSKNTSTFTNQSKNSGTWTNTNKS